MNPITTVGRNLGDFTVPGVYSDNIRVHKNKSNDEYTLTFAFDNNSGLTGMLLRLVRGNYKDIPTYMLRTAVDFTVASLQVPAAYPIFISRYQSLSRTVGGEELTMEVSPGVYPVSVLAPYNPVFSAIVDVKFEGVHIAQEQCGHIETNGVLHKGLHIEKAHRFEATRWFPNAGSGDLYAAEPVVDGIISFEKNRHNMAK